MLGGGELIGGRGSGKGSVRGMGGTLEDGAGGEEAGYGAGEGLEGVLVVA